jgi:site-specific recombinase XerD
MTDLPLDTLLPSWLTALQSWGRAPKTIDSYATSVRQFIAWCDHQGLPADLSRRAVQGFLADLAETGRSPKTMRIRAASLRLFSAWLADEGERDTDPLAGMKLPKPDEKIVHPLTDTQLAGLVAGCVGRDFADRRDEAIVRLLAETGMRSDELMSMQMADLDMGRAQVFIKKAKGGKQRTVSFGPKTGVALDRYLRARRTHRLAGGTQVWLGARGRTFQYGGLYFALKRRAENAGIPDFHPHRLRHTAATRWLSAGGSEGGLMARAGWARRDMMDRYTQATAAERATEEAARLGLGEF